MRLVGCWVLEVAGARWPVHQLESAEHPLLTWITDWSEVRAVKVVGARLHSHRIHSARHTWHVSPGATLSGRSVVIDIDLSEL